MGRLAIPVNIIALIYIAFVFVLTLFPTATPVVPKTMNWAALIWGVVVIFTLINYVLHGKRGYQGPVVHVRKET
jgi:choline transport protein